MTANELRVLDFVRDQIAVTGLAPTLAEIAEGAGLYSKTTAWNLVDSLIDQGLLERAGKRHRNLRLPGTPDLSAVSTDALHAELVRRATSGPSAATLRMARTLGTTFTPNSQPGAAS